MQKHIALFLPSLKGGGVTRALLRLAGALAERGHRVDLAPCRSIGAFSDQTPAAVRVVSLKPALGLQARLRALKADPEGLSVLLRPVLLPLRSLSTLRYLPALERYLARERPDVLFSATARANLVALWAQRLAGVPTRLVISTRNSLSQDIQQPAKRRQWRWRFLPQLIQRAYPWADALVAVSDEVADDLAALARLPRQRIITLYNPVVSPELIAAAAAPLNHLWFSPGSPPVILAVGRLAPQKDLPTLIRAFALLRAQRQARLAILGEGKERSPLEHLVRKLGLEADVILPGFVANPHAWMARAALFVLPSAWEGLPNVLIEAMACGCPVVATDCPGGSSEILENGVHGPLTPVGDSAALAEAMQAVLDAPPNRERLRARADDFSVDRALNRYLEVLLGPEEAAIAQPELIN